MAHDQGMDMKQVNTSEDWEVDVVLQRYDYPTTPENRQRMVNLIKALGKDLHAQDKVLNRKSIYAHFDKKWPDRAPKD